MKRYHGFKRSSFVGRQLCDNWFFLELEVFPAEDPDTSCAHNLCEQ